MATKARLILLSATTLVLGGCRSVYSLEWGQWHIVGRAIAKDAHKGQVILVRIDKPHRGSSSN
jgi:hypothetical protein